MLSGLNPPSFQPRLATRANSCSSGSTGSSLPRKRGGTGRAWETGGILDRPLGSPNHPIGGDFSSWKMLGKWLENGSEQVNFSVRVMNLKVWVSGKSSTF